MSLPVARRGEKDYLASAWSATEFDFGLACRRYGRNDAFWVLCYRRHLDGDALPDEREIRCLAREANRATGYLDHQGQRERYTLHEARATVEQVSSYQGRGIRALTAVRRSSRAKVSPKAIELLRALCDVAELSRRDVFACDHRRLARMIGVDRSRIAGLLRELEDAKQVWRRGFTKARNHARGTSRFTLYPPRPPQRVDEAEPPTFDSRKARWVWSTPIARGRITQSTYRRLVQRAMAVSVPNVSACFASSTGAVASAFREGDQGLLLSRGSP